MVTAAEASKDCQPGPPERKDDAVQLILAIRESAFEASQEVATGRFLREIDDKIHFVQGIDVRGMRALAHGPRWAKIEATYRPSRCWFEAEEDPKTVILELVQEDARWKLEDVNVTSRRTQR